MAILWFDEENKDLIATIASSNITLNKPAKQLIDFAHSVMIGVSPDEKKAYIKALDREAVERGTIPLSQLYTVTIRSSYGRISNKGFVKRIADIIGTEFDTPKKYYMEYDEAEKMLVIDLNEEVM